MDRADELGSLWRAPYLPDRLVGEVPEGHAFGAIQSADGPWERERLIRACQEFEAIFIQEMIKSMRRTVPEFSRSREGTVYRGLFEEEVSRALSVRGLGLKKMMLEVLDREVAHVAAPQVFSHAADKMSGTL